MNRHQRRAAAKGSTGQGSAAAALQFGLANHQAGLLADAERFYRQVLSHQPDHADALHLLGCIYIETKRIEQGVASIRRAIKLHPHNAQFYSNLASGLSRLDRFEEAADAYARSVDIDATSATVVADFGKVLEKLGRMAPALAAFAQAVSIDPMVAAFHGNLGRLLQHFERFDDALTSFDCAVALEPGSASLHCHRSSLLYAMKRLDDALASADLGVAAAPDSDEPHNVRGSALYRLGRLEESLVSFERAMQINPASAEIVLNHATALVDLHRFDEAEAGMERAIQLKPDYAEAHNNLGLYLLLTGKFERGWIETEWRWKCAGLKLKPVDFKQPVWLGDFDIAGKTILLHSDQGLGDVINFVRYAPLVAAKGARVVLAVEPPLVEVLQSVAGVAECIDKNLPLPAFDVHCALASLPLAFNTDLDTIPAQVPYVARHVTNKWKDRLGEKRAPRIGLVWSGNAAHGNDHNRSLAFSQIEPLLDLPCEFYSLQKDVRASDFNPLMSCPRITPLGREIENFADTTALLSEIDLLITVDTSIAHIAGAIAMPTWLMLPYTPDWRWLLGRDDSPWYPTLRLFRQDEQRSYARVIENICAALQAEFATVR